MFCLKLTFREPALLAAHTTINITDVADRAQLFSDVMIVTIRHFPKESAILFLSHDNVTALNVIQNIWLWR